MRRVMALALMGLLTACTTIDDLAPVASRTDVSVTSKVTRAYPRFSDSDPHDWTGSTPWRYAVHGTDVSKYQTSIDWPKAKASGISFAFIKATEGGDRVDDYFVEHWNATRARRRAAQCLSFLLFLPPGFRAGGMVHPQRAARQGRPAARSRHGMEPAIADLQAASSEGDRAPRNAASFSISSRSITARSRSSTPRSTSSTITSSRPSVVTPTGCGR